MSEPRFVIAEYEIELATKTTIQALAVELAAGSRRRVELAPEVAEQLRRNLSADE